MFLPIHARDHIRAGILRAQDHENSGATILAFYVPIRPCVEVLRRWAAPIDEDSGTLVLRKLIAVGPRIGGVGVRTARVELIIGRLVVHLSDCRHRTEDHREKATSTYRVNEDSH